MPAKEDWSSWKHKKHRFLCPYCGNDTISYDTFNKSWRCMKCEECFIRPSNHVPGVVKSLSIVIGWIISIAGVVYLVACDPYWVGIAIIGSGVLTSVLALVLVTRWR